MHRRRGTPLCLVAPALLTAALLVLGVAALSFAAPVSAGSAGPETLGAHVPEGPTLVLVGLALLGLPLLLRKRRDRVG